MSERRELTLLLAPGIKLEITERDSSITATLLRQRKGKPAQILAWCAGSTTGAITRLEIAADPPCIWIDRAAFDLSPEQAELVRDAFPDLRVVGQRVAA